jgi:hypothetical protein
MIFTSYAVRYLLSTLLPRDIDIFVSTRDLYVSHVAIERVSSSYSDVTVRTTLSYRGLVLHQTLLTGTAHPSILINIFFRF